MYPAMGAPSKYPPVHPVTIMPIATETRALPKTLPTTVGMIAKNPPLPMPLTTTKTMSGARDVDTGHNTSMLTALTIKDKKRVFTGPTLSPKRPQTTRPTADEKLNVATNAAPTWPGWPIDRAYRGRKNGGTKRGNVAVDNEFDAGRKISK